MKIIHKMLLVLVIVILCMCTGCSKNVELNAEKYTSYICYDYHLACLETEDDIASADVTYRYEGDTTDITDRVIYRKIADESDDQFIHATVLPKLLLGTSDKIIMQNPDNYVDVWKDWTIKNIELYYVHTKQPIEQNTPAIIPSQVIASTSDLECYSELTEFVVSDHNAEEFVCPEGYTREHYRDGTGYSYYIRVYFNGSESIVWDSEVISYFSTELQNRMICIDKGRKPDGLASTHSKNVPISNYTQLYAWISKSIGSIAFE